MEFYDIDIKSHINMREWLTNQPNMHVKKKKMQKKKTHHEKQHEILNCHKLNEPKSYVRFNDFLFFTILTCILCVCLYVFISCCLTARRRHRQSQNQRWCRHVYLFRFKAQLYKWHSFALSFCIFHSYSAYESNIFSFQHVYSLSLDVLNIPCNSSSSCLRSVDSQNFPCPSENERKI